MRNLVLLFTALILGTSGIMASTTDDKVAIRNAYRYDNSFIFVESGITFSVFPDGEFDFYIDNYVNGRRNKITFNSGYDYSPYAQYDDYGAVIQVENLPIYYDYYGRVSQIGDVDINYRNGRVYRMGGMYVYYNRSGFYDYHTGYINVYNRHYVYRPFHRLFLRPSLGLCLVFNKPYRRYYNPYRYTYYSPYKYNRRWGYAKVGREHRYNRVRRERASVYRNDRRVSVRENRTRRGDAVRSNRTVGRRNSKAIRSSSTRRGDVARNNRSARRSTATQSRSNRSRSKIAGRTAVDRSKGIKRSNVKRGNVRSNNRSVTKRSTTVRTPKRGTVTKRTVTRTPQSRTVTRSTKTYKKPQSRSRGRSVSKAPSRSRSTASRRSAPRKTVSRTPQRNSRSKTRSVSKRNRSRQ